MSHPTQILGRPLNSGSETGFIQELLAGGMTYGEALQLDAERRERERKNAEEIALAKMGKSGLIPPTPVLEPAKEPEEHEIENG